MLFRAKHTTPMSKTPPSERRIRAQQRFLAVAPYALSIVLACWLLAPNPDVVLILRFINLAVWLLASHLVWYYATRDWKRRCAWLPVECCGDMADFIDRNEDLLPYHEKVLATGRRYTCGEYADMEEWVRQRNERKVKDVIAASHSRACRRLYRIESTGEEA